MTKDEAARLPALLASLPPGVRVLVLDACSSDDTVALAERAGARVETRAWRGFVDARRYLLARVDTPWTLMLDADERLDAAARDGILAAPETYAGFRIRRTTRLCGAPIRAAGWSTEQTLRLFRTDRARVVTDSVAGAAELHEKWIVDGPVRTLPGTIEHESYPTLAAYREKFARYTRIEAAALPPSFFALAREAAMAPLRFLWALGRYAGWRDGWRGFYVAWQSARYRVVVRAMAIRRDA